MGSEIWLGLFSGIAFGFVIQRVGATNADKMAKAHLMLQGGIPKFMLMAIILSAIGLLGLEAAGVANTRVLPTSLVATGVAGILFGIGWGFCGYCPGTTWAAAGEGRMDAVFALIGGLAGAAVFAHLHGYLVPLLYDPFNVGQITLADWTASRPAAVILLVSIFGLCIGAINFLWKEKNDGRTQ
ncbi:YeeE/YedE thiosulfate transporter family protein [Desulfatitalea alkaliphila]|uniref:YeeE/YedE family protein n=1 Tax=Desulfatitalea alkaliphila TaxID=2929485 RepID=A0AA41R198_9BACT|nr:YeeE/YedE thiosulfate transporter family protein [Desulfatitalea alkaliphila]MCJ8499016.1 YeeE/YedE family protein [Desulfatitalea alkaliphila]